MATKVTTIYKDGLAFDTISDGHHLVMDVSADAGGKDLGPRPKPLLLAALSGCSGMDVVSILQKMQVKGYTFRIEMEADSTSEHPITYHTIRMNFIFDGDDLPADKIRKAVDLSLERYCGVNAMLRKAANIIPGIIINDQEVPL
jgi:putative redox protein